MLKLQPILDLPIPPGIEQYPENIGLSELSIPFLTTSQLPFIRADILNDELGDSRD